MSGPEGLEGARRSLYRKLLSKSLIGKSAFSDISGDGGAFEDRGNITTDNLVNLDSMHF